MRTLTVILLVATVLVAAPDAEAVQSVCFGRIATIVGAGTIDGTPGDDVIVGSDGDDTIDGMGGNDDICGRDGDDIIVSGLGLDQLGVALRFDGGPGHDQLRSSVSAVEAHMFGGDGDDNIADLAFRFSATIEISGGAGNDTIYSDPTNADSKATTISGGSGNDEIEFGNVPFEEVGLPIAPHPTLSITIDGGGGNDRIRPNPNPVNIESPSVPITVVLNANGRSGDDVIQGALLVAGGAPGSTIRNTLRGGTGDDELRAGSGAGVTNLVDGGAGTDACYRGGVGSGDHFKRCDQILTP
jgi:Ca2+-binding RTX toxin-like protein